MQFLDREVEMASLRRIFAESSSKGSLVIIHGRRRIGKTELLKQFAKGKDSIYLLATLQNQGEVISRMSVRAAEFFDDQATIKNPQQDWDGLLTYLEREIGGRTAPLLVIFDEFTYCIQQDRSVVSVFQAHWDEKMRQQPIMLVLCGSQVGMMEKEVLSYRSPLYGRRTAQIQLGELPFPCLREAFPHYTDADLVRTYAILGGIPFYLDRFDPAKDLAGNIEDNILDKHQILFSDVHYLLREELQEPRSYMSILAAIAMGKTSPKEIADTVAMAPTAVSKYLDTLGGLGLVRRLVPAFEDAARSKKGSYRISDNYTRFWFRFVQANSDLLEMGKQKEVLDTKILPGLDTFTGPVFESLARNWLNAGGTNRYLRGNYPRIDAWWSRTEEIDLLGYDASTKCLLAGEVKWSDLRQLEATQILANLKRKVSQARLQLEREEEEYCIVARTIQEGTAEAMPEARLITLADIVSDGVLSHRQHLNGPDHSRPPTAP